MRISDWSSDVCSSDLQQPSRPLVPKDWWEADYPPVSEQPEAIRPVVREDFAQQRISNEARRQREAQQRKQQETVMLQKEEPVVRTEERRVGKESVRTFRSRW